MSYTPVYTSFEAIEEITQITIDDRSVPSYTAVLRWIEQIESRVVARALGSHTVTDQYIDVPVGDDIYPNYTWYYEVDGARLKFDIEGGYVVPLGDVKYPVISITSLYKNDADFEDAPNWEQLTEWDGSTDDTHFMLLTSGRKNSGYALWFYEEEPEPGPKRLKMSYTYGNNIDPEILEEWVTLNVCVKILVARMGTNQKDSLATLRGVDVGRHINQNYSDRIGYLRAQIIEIEAFYFPRRRAEDDGFAMEVI